jgi:DMSO/TMAO reductase YedYZ molybdopterin-dependent catalytic subunit
LCATIFLQMNRKRMVGVLALLVTVAFILLLIPSPTPPTGPPITPNDRFFTVSYDGIPQVNISGYTLTVFGLVNNSLTMSYADIISMNSSSEKETVRCVDGPSGTAVWVGVRLGALLDRAGMSFGAQEVVFYGLDGYSTSLKVADAKRNDVIVAYEMNNATLPSDQGYPVRMVIPGEWGYKWAKWVYAIEIVGYDYRGYWEGRGWADDATINPISDWFIHAALMSIAFALGIFSTLSGLRNSLDKKTADMVPDIFDPKYHRYVSIAFYLIVVLTFFYWISITEELRGAIFYSLHGRLALLTMGFALFGIITGIGMGKDPKRYRISHQMSNLTCLSLMAITIILGVLLAVG